MLQRIACVLAACAALAAAAQSTCPARLFVSGYRSTVHVYDACTGAYVRDLDSRTRLRGAQAIRLGPDGFVYVVAEEAGFIHRYRNDTLEYAGQFAAVPGIGATGLVFDAAGIAYVAGYNSGDVKKYDRNGGALGAAFPSRASGLLGPDNGMTFGPDGNLYIPGYDSHSVVRFDPRTGETSVAVAARTAGIFQTRGLLPARDGQHMYITAEGSGQLLRWNLASGEVVQLRAGLTQPTGIDYAPDGNLLITDLNSVIKVNPQTGATIATLVGQGVGGVNGLTFVQVIATAGAGVVDATQIGSQYWVVGDAVFNGRVLELNALVSATGTAFGPDLRFSELAIQRWGTARNELTACDRATFAWTSTGADSANFGSGGYPIERYFANEATARCQQQGLDAADKSWVNGQWWGGEARSGEGLFLHRRADGTTFFAWFTHRPAAGVVADATQVGTQYWVVGDGVFNGRTLAMTAIVSATGTSFGPGLDRRQLAIKRWGGITIELLSCTTARLTWASSGADTANFGDGGYDLVRYFDDESSARCLQQGVDHADKSWVNGQWWGGAARSGEGLFLDRRSDGTTFFAWFTHRPR